MYEAHFGLTGRPFSETVNAADFVALPSRVSVLHRLRYGLEHGRGPALLFGPPGSGKTLLARVLARDLGGPAVHLTFPSMPAADLIALLADELTGTTGPAAPGVSVRRLRSALSASALRGRRILLVVDEAHLIEEPSTFETLRLVLNFATTGPPDLMLLLVGGPEVLLHMPPGLADRLAARGLLGPLTEDEAGQLLRARLSAAGAKTELFDDETVSALYHAADGMPRRLIRLADLSLLIAYAEGRPRPDPRSAGIAADELLPEPMAV